MQGAALKPRLQAIHNVYNFLGGEFADTRKAFDKLQQSGCHLNRGLNGRCARRIGVEPEKTREHLVQEGETSAGHGRSRWSILEGSMAEGGIGSRCWWGHAPDQQHWVGEWWITAGLILSRPVTSWPLLCMLMVERGGSANRRTLKPVSFVWEISVITWEVCGVLLIIGDLFCQVVCRSLDAICCSCYRIYSSYTLLIKDLN